MHISILDTLNMMCTKNLCPIFLLTYFTNLFFGSFLAAILFSWCKQEVNSSGHVTIYSKHATLHIFNWDLYYFNICWKCIDRSFSKNFIALEMKHFFTVTIVTGGIKWVNHLKLFFSNICIFYPLVYWNCFWSFSSFSEEIVAGAEVAGSAPAEVWSRGALFIMYMLVFYLIALISSYWSEIVYAFSLRYRPFVPHIPFDFYVVSSTLILCIVKQ